MSKIHIIAEAGNNHNGNVEIAEKLIDVAVDASADSVKFQIIYPEGLYLPKIYESGKYMENDVFNKRIAGMLSDDDYRRISNYSREKGIQFSSSIFDERGIDLLDELGSSYFKIASCDLNNSYLLKKAAERGKKMIIATGMASLGEIERAVNDIYSTGNSDIVLLHCVSVYPCATEHMNLSFIKVLQQAFGLPVGLSDHSENSIAGAVAVSMGVSWIEKHFTFDRNAEGFDHSYAMEPNDLKKYIQDIRSAELACKLQNNKVQTAEANVKNRARRALYAARDIEIGEKIKESDLLIVRPEGPLEPNQACLVLDRNVNRKIYKYEPLSLDMFFYK